MGGKRRTNKEVIAGRSVPVNLGEELCGSLRQLKAQGSVLLDKVMHVNDESGSVDHNGS